MKVIIKNLQKKIQISPTRIRKAILKALSLKAEKLSGEITVCFVSDFKIRQLNSRYLGKDSPTDVIAFNLSQDKRLLLADIAISADTALRNARTFGTSPDYELRLYAVHGLLHLLGYNDATARQRKSMEEKAFSILKTCLSRKPRH